MLNVGNQRRALNATESSFFKSSTASVVCMYTEPPIEDVSLDAFEEAAIDRLYVLREIERYRSSGLHHKELEHKLDKTLNIYLPVRPSTLKEDTKKDILSHYILRIAFCQNEELRRWLLTHECFLFRYRLDRLSNDDKLLFLKKNGCSFEQVSKEEIDERRSQLKDVRDSILLDINERQRELGPYFRIPFNEALELVAHRKVYLEKGYAYVALDNLVAILTARFRSNLSQQLAVAYKNFSKSQIGDDERLIPVLKNLSKQYLGPQYSDVSTNSSSCTADQVDVLAKTSMPLCMSTLHNALKLQHHLKHGGRMQYGLFLKGIGLSMEEALIFWRREFKKIPSDEFNKKYAYNIRHNYGKEGKRTDYTPYNCTKIINGEPPKSGDYHGCPFRHMDEYHLKAALGGISEVERDGILLLARTKQYQLACRRHFEARYPNSNSDPVGNHPNSYYEANREFYSNISGSDTAPVIKVEK